MGDGVFGNPVTDSTLKGMPEYADNQRLQPIHRARVALIVKNAEGKDVRALNYLENLNEAASNPNRTLCLIYNATGGTVQYAGNNIWNGQLGTAPYPILIANGQWGAFLHRGDGSIGAVVYRGKNNNNIEQDWMVGWHNPQDRQRWLNRVYTEVRVRGNFNANAWPTVRHKLSESDIVETDTGNGGQSFVAIGQDRITIFRAILTLVDVIDK